MGRLAKRRLIKGDARSSAVRPEPTATHQLAYTRSNLTRGLAQGLPFRDGSFDTVIATFPAEYIYDPRTLSEVSRCLSGGGRFVVLPVAMPTNRFLSWLFKVTDQAPSDALEIIREKMQEPFVKSNFDVEIKVIEKPSGTLVVIIAKKKRQSP